MIVFQNGPLDGRMISEDMGLEAAKMEGIEISYRTNVAGIERVEQLIYRNRTVTGDDIMLQYEGTEQVR